MVFCTESSEQWNIHKSVLFKASIHFEVTMKVVAPAINALSIALFLLAFFAFRPSDPTLVTHYYANLFSFILSPGALVTIVVANLGPWFLSRL